MLTGTVEIIWELDEELSEFKGAERGWRFTLEHGVKLNEGLPFRSKLGEFSPNSLMTGNWQEATASLGAKKKANSWRPFQVSKIIDESENIRSFYFEANDGLGLPSFEAGQYLTLKLQPLASDKAIIRTYTVSSAPNENYYRISVKKEPSGLGSNYLHDAISIGDIVELKVPNGEFYIDASKKRPAVLLSAGVGVTPMVSMAQHIKNEGIRHRYTRPLHIFHSAKTTAQRAFSQQFKQLSIESHGAIQYYSFISDAITGEKAGVDFNSNARISADALQQVLPIDDYDFYICGPSSFMQSMYSMLMALGVQDKRIFAESFGGAAITRIESEVPDINNQTLLKPEAKNAVINFTHSNVEQAWQQGGDTILAVAEAQGLAPDFGCRSGGCGACKVKIKSGEVTYRSQPTFNCASDEALICCAVPAEGSEIIELDL